MEGEGKFTDIALGIVLFNNENDLKNINFETTSYNAET